MKLSTENWFYLLERINRPLETKSNFKIGVNGSGIEIIGNEYVVLISQGFSSGEIRCSVESLKSGERVSIQDIRRSRNESGIYLYPRDKNSLEYIATKIREALEEIMKSDMEAFENIFNDYVISRDEGSSEAMNRHFTAPLKEKAQVAWREKEYVRVVEIYEGILDKLTDSELRKYRYSKKAIGRG